MVLKESQLRNIIKECVTRVLKESLNSNDVLNKVYVTYGLGDDYDAEKFRGVNLDSIWSKMVNKPEGGLWASPIDSDWGWSDWSKSEGYNIDSLEHHFLFRLSPNAKIWVIDNYEDFDRELLDYSGGLNFREMINRGYDGIFVTEDAIRDFRMHDIRNLKDLYSWDVESICVFNKDIIIPIKENGFDKLTSVPFHGNGSTEDDDWSDSGSKRKKMQMNRDYEMYGNKNLHSDMDKAIRDTHPAITAQGDESDPRTQQARRFNGTMKSGL